MTLTTAVALCLQAGLIQAAAATQGAGAAGVNAKGTSATAASAATDAAVTLITGDRVLVESNGGRKGVIVDSSDRGPGTAPVAFSTFVWYGDTYVVPSDAIPYLGHPLALALFDVSALIRDGIGNGADLPLSITYSSGASAESMPGIQADTPQGNQATATQPVIKAPEFGQALSLQLQADVAAAHGKSPVVPSHLFDGVARIDLAAADPSAGASSTAPQGTFRMHTLTLNAIDRDGDPASGGIVGNGYMIVDNVDDPYWFGVNTPVTGSQRWSVPAGDYEVRAYIYTWFQKQVTFQDPAGSYTETVWDYSMSFVWDPQVHVNRDTTVTLDARAAKAIPIPTTPDADTGTGWRHAADYCCDPIFQMTSDRVSRNGLDIPDYWTSGAHALGSDDASLEMFATQNGTATTGTAHFYTYYGLSSPSTGHIYDLIYPTSGSVPSDFPTGVSKSGLAAIPTSYDSEAPGRTGGMGRLSWQPWEAMSVRLPQPITEPLTRTEYVLADGAAAQTVWQEQAAMYNMFPYLFADDEAGPYTSYSPGAQPAVTWFGAPRRPGVDQPGQILPITGAASAFTCPVCRDNGHLSLDIKPYIGGDPQHWAGALTTGDPLRGISLTDQISLKYYENGALVSAQDRTSNPSLGRAPVLLPMAAGSASYRIDYDVTRSAPWTSLSTQTMTAWDFTSRAPNTSDPLPAGWSCGQLVSPCAFVPMLFADYNLPLDDADTAPAPGDFSFTLHLYHQPHSSSPAAIGTPQVSASFDDGSSWTPAAGVSDLGSGDYRVTVTHPDPATVSGFVSLRVRASDSDGSSIDQTILRAYILRGSAAAAGAGAGGGSEGGTAGGGGGMAGGGGGMAGGVPVCAAEQVPFATCNAVLATNAAGQAEMTNPAKVTPGSPPPGYGPDDLRSAYKLPASRGDGQTVAVVDAAGDPNVESDLATYRAQYGLPPCTADNGCLRIVGQDGSPVPSGSYNNHSWGLETALDLDMVSASCPECHILLVEARFPNVDMLAQAEDTAVKLGATIISNSYGVYEFAGEQDYAASYEHPGVAIVASSGDSGFGLYGTSLPELGGTQFPASLSNVIAVGGTSLKADPASARGWAETAWSGSGSGCSAYFAKPSWQQDALCKMRTVADVAAVADPQTGVAVYDSYLPGGLTGGRWLVMGGTSAAAPLIAGVYGLAGNAQHADSPAYIYGQSKSLFDITDGSNGICGLGNYLCNAKHGYDGPTGLGSPDGVGAF